MTTPRPQRRRRWLVAAMAAILGTVLGLALVEVVLRVFDPIGLHYAQDFQRYLAAAVRFAWDGRPAAETDLDGHLFRHKPGLDLDLGSFRLRTNQLGCRGPEVAEPKPAGVFRILLLGDSVAFGWGVDDEHTFARRLEREWNATSPPVRLEVVNTGHPLYDTTQQAATLQEFLPRLQPDLVLLVYVVNDIEPTRDLAEGLLSGKQPPPAETLTLPDDGWSLAAAWLQPVLPALSQLLGTQSDMQRRVRPLLGPGETYAPERFGRGPRGWVRSQAALLRLRDLCAAAEVPFVLFDHTLPAIPSLPPFCRAQGIELVPLRFSAADHARGITNSMIDSHANAQGHDLLLQRLRAALDERRLLPR